MLDEEPLSIEQRSSRARMPNRTRVAIDAWTLSSSMVASCARYVRATAQPLVGLRTQTIADVVAAYAAPPSIDVAPHDCRRTFAKLALKGGARRERSPGWQAGCVAWPERRSVPPAGRVFRDVDWVAAFGWLASQHGLRLAHEQEAGVWWRDLPARAPGHKQRGARIALVRSAEPPRRRRRAMTRARCADPRPRLRAAPDSGAWPPARF
jgi:hypothetical protein